MEASFFCVDKYKKQLRNLFDYAKIKKAFEFK